MQSVVIGRIRGNLGSGNFTAHLPTQCSFCGYLYLNTALHEWDSLPTEKVWLTVTLFWSLNLKKKKLKEMYAIMPEHLNTMHMLAIWKKMVLEVLPAQVGMLEQVSSLILSGFTSHPCKNMILDLKYWILINLNHSSWYNCKINLVLFPAKWSLLVTNP
jgi:hypothetical protein